MTFWYCKPWHRLTLMTLLMSCRQRWQRFYVRYILKAQKKQIFECPQSMITASDFLSRHNMQRSRARGLLDSLPSGVLSSFFICLAVLSKGYFMISWSFSIVFICSSSLSSSTSPCPISAFISYSTLSISSFNCYAFTCYLLLYVFSSVKSNDFLLFFLPSSPCTTGGYNSSPLFLSFKPDAS